MLPKKLVIDEITYNLETSEILNDGKGPKMYSVHYVDKDGNYPPPVNVEYGDGIYSEFLDSCDFSVEEAMNDLTYKYLNMV